MADDSYGGGLGGQRSGDYGDGTRGGGYSGNPRDGTEGHDPNGARRRKPLPPEYLALQLEDGRTLGDVAGYYGFGVFRGSGLRLADGRLVEQAIRPYSLGGAIGPDGLGRFGGFGPGRKRGRDARAAFAIQERMRKERIAALSRLGFGRTILTGPQGAAGAAPLAKGSLGSG